MFASAEGTWLTGQYVESQRSFPLELTLRLGTRCRPLVGFGGRPAPAHGGGYLR